MMKIAAALSAFGLLLATATAASVPRAANDVGPLLNALDDFSGLIKETKPILEDIDFDNGQAEAERVRDKLDEMLDTSVLLLKSVHEPGDFDAFKMFQKDEQSKVCTKYDEFTTDFLDFLLSLHTVAIGIDANSKGVTKRVLYIMEQFFFAFDYLRQGPLQKIAPMCSNKAVARANDVLEELKVLIRAYGGRTDCSRPGGPIVNAAKTCTIDGQGNFDLPGGLIPNSHRQ